MFKYYKNNKKLLLIYILLLFNPISYSDAFSFVYRDGIYTILLMFLLSFSFQVFFNKDKNIKKYIIYTILYSLIITPILLCREETLCILPYIIISILLTIIFILFNKKDNYKVLRLLTLIILPIVVYTTTTGIISYNNKIHYNRYVVNDFTSKDFKELYGSLTRIKQDNYLLRVPLNKETRLKLYELSPTFRELEPYLESDDFSKYRRNEYNDYLEGFLYWAVRDAAYQLGYYADANKSYEFNIRLTKEIDDICDNNKLDCYPKRSSLVAPINKELYNEILIYIPKSFITQITYDKIQVKWNNKQQNKFINKVTKDNLEYKNKNDIRITLMNFLLNVYKIINPIIFTISLVYLILIIIYMIINKCIKKYYNYIILILGLSFLYLLRIFAVGIVAATEYTSALDKAQYLSSIYNIQLLLSMIIIVLYYKIKVDKKKK